MRTNTTKLHDAEPPETLLRTADVSEWIQVPPRTLDQWAYLNRGPAYVRIGRHRRYRRSDVEQWINANTIGGGQ